MGGATSGKVDSGFSGEHAILIPVRIIKMVWIDLFIAAGE
jgi:hypothetical protein